MMRANALLNFTKIGWATQTKTDSFFRIVLKKVLILEME